MKNHKKNSTSNQNKQKNERKIITLHYPKKNQASNSMKGTHTHKKENKRDNKNLIHLLSLIEIVPLL